MSLPDPAKQTMNRSGVRAGRLVTGAVLLSVALASACTVRPLYSNQPLTVGGQTIATEELASISVKPVRTRYAQQVRNNLIFGLTHGKGEPASPVYSLDLGVTESIQSAASIQVTTDQDEPSAGIVTLTADYRLTEVSTGKLVGAGKRSISSSFDRPKQEFATYRAELDAENRAARELAEILRLALAQDLAKRK
ncbi:LPS-assembly lipoprotein [Aquamicrobium lusatiense]|uniref:LPS-assembly lipoprotein n=1 Tax=Aquamicrobium lusatiense TaxID=89772 RepID=A0A7W9RYJ4_9HYPH|nr:LPS assembly lipoprotein LptE [Aquamicrobium lusatiense]MBB6010852.1 LPS-assembly lipoprotein [Aquamicrobium lusatiense]